jgi:hypothetical protein
MMKSDSAKVKMCAMLCLTAIAITALSHGIDSVLLSTISAVIGGIAGYKISGRR